MTVSLENRRLMEQRGERQGSPCPSSWAPWPDSSSADLVSERTRRESALGEYNRGSAPGKGGREQHAPKALRITGPPG